VALCRTSAFLIAVILTGNAHSVCANNPTPARKPPTLKEVEAQPANYLGQSLKLDATIAPESKPVGNGAELSVSIDSRTPIVRLRFLVPRSVAETIAGWKEPRKVRIAGTVLAAESVRTGYHFEIEEIAVLGDGDAVVETIKLDNSALVPDVPKNVEVASAPKSEPVKPAETIRKGGVPTVLVVGAALMAAFLAVLAVIGFRLLKYMKMKPKPTRRRLDSPPVESLSN
jgi:hypothetical protein